MSVFFFGDMTDTAEFDNLDIVALAKNEIVIVGRPDHPLHKLAPQKLRDVLHYLLALPHLHKYWGHIIGTVLLEDDQRKLGERRIPQIECDDYSLVANIAENSNLLSGGTRENFVEQLEIGTLREIPLEDTPSWNIFSARQKGARFPMADFFWRFATNEWRRCSPDLQYS